jgi:hypothetical protein
MRALTKEPKSGRTDKFEMYLAAPYPFSEPSSGKIGAGSNPKRPSRAGGAGGPGPSALKRAQAAKIVADRKKAAKDKELFALLKVAGKGRSTSAALSREHARRLRNHMAGRKSNDDG